jgi:hypothetical protein
MPSLLRLSTREIYLDSDASIDASDRPTFIARVMSVGEFLDFADLLDQLAKATTNKSRLNAAVDCVNHCVVGWRNMITAQGENIPFCPESLKKWLTIEEVTELVGKISAEQQLSETDKKKSE